MKQFEYEQQIQHLKIPFEQLDFILQEICKGTNYQYAWILHDKDTDTEPHIHVMFNLGKNDMKAKNVCKWFNDDPQYINIKKTRWENKLSYLVHRTENSKDKYQYDPTSVTANFDYCKKLEEIKTEIDKVHHIEDTLSKIMTGEIPYIKINQYLTNEERLKHHKRIEIAYKIKEENSLREIDRKMEVTYIQGVSGSGKTSLVKYLSKMKNYDVCTCASMDAFQNYIGQEVVSLDDFRPSDMKFNQLLKVLDNNTSSPVPARYRNKMISECKQIFITSTLPIEEFYSNIQESNEENKIQLYRRIKNLIVMDKETIEFYIWNDNKLKYEMWTKTKNWIQDIQWALNQTDNVKSMFLDAMNTLKEETLPF